MNIYKVNVLISNLTSKPTFYESNTNSAKNLQFAESRICVYGKLKMALTFFW